MRHDLITVKPLQSSFLSCEKDTEKIIKTLLVDTQPYSETLKRLLIVNEPDCLDMQEYQNLTEKYSVGDVIQQGYVRLSPRIKNGENETVKSFIIISFDNFAPNETNYEFRDCTINFDVICNIDAWIMDDYKIRPLQICGYIDGIFNLYNQHHKKPDTKLTGIGQYVYLGCNELILDEHFAGYTISYRAVHFTEDEGNVQK